MNTRILCAAAVLLIAAASLSAREKKDTTPASRKPEISLGFGGAPFYDGKLFHGSYGRPFAKYDVEPGGTNLSNIYGTRSGDTYSFGVASLEVDLPVRTWFSLPFVLAGSLNTTLTEDSLTDKVTRKFDGGLHLMTGGKFLYMRKDHVNLYSSVLLGVAFCDFGDGGFDGVLPDVQLVPVGVRAGGKHLFGFAELELGTLICGGQIGIGYKF